jgi:hypothetical protein
VGIKWKEQIVSGWYFMGDVNGGFDNSTLSFDNGPRSLVQNNSLPQYYQSANSDSSRTYGPINTRAYAGVQNQTFGTLSPTAASTRSPTTSLTRCTIPLAAPTHSP